MGKKKADTSANKANGNGKYEEELYALHVELVKFQRHMIATGGRVLMVSYEGWRRAEMQADFARSSGVEIAGVWLDRKHRRRIEMFVGEGFAPRPRDAVSGLPTPP